MSLFGNIGSANYSEGGVYVLPGVYRFEVTSVIAKRTRTQKDCFIAELRVLESTNPERVAGSVCSWMVVLAPDSPAMGNIKQFISAVVGCEMSQVTEQVAEAIVSAQQPLKGKYVRASAINIMTKQNRPFTKVKWIIDSAGSAAAHAEHVNG